jgi:hypothetical protein
MVLRRTLGPKMDEITGEWRRLHNEKLVYLHSGDKIKNQMSRACSTYGERRGACRASVRKPEGRRPVGRPRRRWEDNT